MDRLPDDVVSFWGGAFSNFEVASIELACPFTGEPRTYSTVEHYFQACKAITLGEHIGVAEQATAKDAKRAGRRVELRTDWEDVKVDVMLTALRAKFRLERFRKLLLATEDRLIVEDSPYDFEWGIRDQAGGLGGRNLMGEALMKVRDELRAGAVPGDQLALKVDG